MKNKKRLRLTGVLLLLILGCCFLTAILSGLIYGISSLQLTQSLVVTELESRAKSLSRLSARYLEGTIVRDTFQDFYTAEMEGVSVFLYDDQGDFHAHANQEDSDGDDEDLASLVAEALETSNTAITKRLERGMIAVAEPLRDNFRRVIGVIVLVKPAVEVYAAFQNLVISAVISIAAASLTMAVPAYLLARRTARPIRVMTEMAGTMAEGHFDVKIPQEGTRETASLAEALNDLSHRLGTTISDLTDTRELLSNILSGISEGVLAYSLDSKAVEFQNEAAAGLLDGSDITVFADSMLSDMEKACTGEQPVITHWEKQGRSYALTMTSLPLDESSRSVIILFHDVTEAERLEKTRRDYVANVSHELRTPIASIRSLAETLNDGIVTGEEERSRYYGYILRESARLTRLINDLLELSRLQSGTVALERRPFDLDATIQDVAERMRITASYSGSDVIYEHADLPQCNSNSDRVEQILVALIDNAIKYGEEGEPVRITAVRADEHNISVSVANAGNISEESIPQLFDRFYKADASHSGNGTGLGLAIVRETLTLLGGSINCKNSGTETIFTFLLPVAE